METRLFGRTDLRVSALGFGGAEIGYEKAPLATVGALLNGALDAGLNVIAKRPIANAAWVGGGKPANRYAVPYWQRLQVLRYEFLREDPRRGVATALRFTLSVPGVHLVIVGTKRTDRWRENLAIVQQGPLEPAAFTAIRRRWKEAAPPDWVALT